MVSHRGVLNPFTVAMGLLCAAILFIGIVSAGFSIQSTRPFIGTDIRINYHENPNVYVQSNGRDFFPQSISELSTATISTVSATPPKVAYDVDFQPFGEKMRVQFRTTSVEGTEDDFTFILSVDDTVISSDVNQPSIVTSSEGRELGFMKRLTYAGSRIDENGEEQTLIIAVTPNGIAQDGVYGDYSKNGIKSGLETQSGADFAPLSMAYHLKIQSRNFAPLSNDVQSGRQENGYTIQGVLYTSKKEYQIDTYRALIFEKLSDEAGLLKDLNTAEQSLSDDVQVQSDIIMKLQSQLDQVGEMIEQLYQQRIEASYDLALSEVVAGPDDGSRCGHISPETGNVETENVTPFKMSPQWSLTQWENCHKWQNKKSLVLTHDISAAANWQFWASNTSTAENVNPAMVQARVQLVFSMGNKIVNQQWDTSYSLNSLVMASTTEYTTWNPEPGTVCQTDPILGDFAAYFRPLSKTVALGHNFLRCSASSSTIGLAWVGTVCGGYYHYAWSIFGSALASGVVTWLHEAGHNLSLSHSGEGSIMSPYISLSGLSGTAPENDLKHLGFHIGLDRGVCTKLDWLIDQKSTTTCLRPQPTPDPVYTIDLVETCNGNNTIEIFEECDFGPNPNQCCNSKCQLHRNAVCFTESECCVGCQAVGVDVACALASDAGTNNKSGFCQLGNCAANPSVCSKTTFEGAKLCDGGFTAGNICKSSCVDCNSREEKSTPNVPNKTHCGITQNGVNMECLDGECLPSATPAVYTWRIFTLRECSITDNVISPQLDKYHCLDKNGDNVGRNLCSTVPMPEPKSTTEGCVSFIEISNPDVVIPLVEIEVPFEITWKYKGSFYYNVEITIPQLATPLATVPGYFEKATVTLPKNIISTNLITFTLRRVKIEQENDEQYPVQTEQVQIRGSFWAIGDWSECVIQPNKECALYKTTRTVECQLYPENTPQDEAQCAEAGPKPETEQECKLGCDSPNLVCNLGQCQCDKGFKPSTGDQSVCVEAFNDASSLQVLFSFVLVTILAISQFAQ